MEVEIHAFEVKFFVLILTKFKYQYFQLKEPYQHVLLKKNKGFKKKEDVARLR